MDTHVAQLRNGRVVYPPDMFGNLTADLAFVVEHNFREHHPVERFTVFEGKEYRCDTILAE